MLDPNLEGVRRFDRKIMPVFAAIILAILMAATTYAFSDLL